MAEVREGAHTHGSRCPPKGLIRREIFVQDREAKLFGTHTVHNSVRFIAILCHPAPAPPRATVRLTPLDALVAGGRPVNSRS
jgi:hypothetical protein